MVKTVRRAAGWEWGNLPARMFFQPSHVTLVYTITSRAGRKPYASLVGKKPLYPSLVGKKATSVSLPDEVLHGSRGNKRAQWAACVHPSLPNCFVFSFISLLPHPTPALEPSIDWLQFPCLRKTNFVTFEPP